MACVPQGTALETTCVYAEVLSAQPSSEKSAKAKGMRRKKEFKGQSHIATVTEANRKQSTKSPQVMKLNRAITYSMHFNKFKAIIDIQKSRFFNNGFERGHKILSSI